jgi:glycosyltransferase involved in cell wall biosynthesis
MFFNGCTICERLFKKYWDVYVEKILPQALEIINSYKPDVIQIFGTEWPFGQIAKYTSIPIVVHIQGAIVPYNNALYPPGYSIYDRIRLCGFNLKKYYSLYRTVRDIKNWEEWERDTWQCVSNYMGRTKWDQALANVMHPYCQYFHVDEALRSEFIEEPGIKWTGYKNKKIKLISTGCSTFWKGPDMLLKVARILKQLNIDFEWNVAGNMPKDIQCIVEHKENAKFVECNVNILGFIQPDVLSKLLCSSSIYVHTAYIENSPNSICEAQCLGVPIISTNVGGISSLVQDGIGGILVPANDPWQMAYSIVSLCRDKNKMISMSESSKSLAIRRHDKDNIKTNLLLAYKSLTIKDEAASI